MSGVLTREGAAPARARLSAASEADGRLSSLFDAAHFALLVSLVPLTAVPYGTVEPWWEAVFECACFALFGVWIIRQWHQGRWETAGAQLFWPLLALAAFAFAQTLPLGSAAGSSAAASISADPYETRRFILKLLALLSAGWLFLRYAADARRLRVLVHVVIITGAAAALFAVARETAQGAEGGFLLPHLSPGRGYGQFINRNHFALMMLMSFGTTAGLLLGGGVRRERLPAYLGLALLTWSALVLSGSRGGLIAMACQLLFALLLLGAGPVRRKLENADSGKHVRASRSVLAHASLALMAACLIAALAVGVAWIGGDAVADRVASLPDEAAAESADGRRGVRRTDIWAATWRLFEERPLFGAGFGGYWVAVTRHHEASGDRTLLQAHNDYLELLASGGIVGAGLAAWFAVAFVRRAKRVLAAPEPFRRAARAGALVGLAGAAVHGVFDFGLHTTSNALMFAALAAVATSCADGGTARRAEA